MKQVYPIILTPAANGYVVFVPHININTEGETLTNAIEMARDAICLWAICEEDMGRKIPEPTDFTPKHSDNELVSLVDVDISAYRRANENRTIRKNVTLPSWLNVIAEQNNVNFSGVLQNALIEQLHISR